MSGEWKAGDVMSVGSIQRTLTYVGSGLWRWTHQEPEDVVVIPSNRAAVERLRDLYDEAYLEHNGFALPPTLRADRGNALQAALREFARPTPSIEEPQGLGAVVEGAAGHLFVRACNCGCGGWRANQSAPLSGSLIAWEHLHATRILSPGYDPEATS